MFFATTKLYTAVSESDSEKLHESEDNIRTHLPYPQRVKQFLKEMNHLLPWAISLIFFIVCLVLLYISNSGSRTCSNENLGSANDFGPAKHLVKYEQVAFTGGFKYTDNGTMFVSHTGPIKYVGDPSPEIDKNWEELIKGRYFPITEQQAKEAWGERYTEFYNDAYPAYIAGLDMFHTLHCVNRLRELYYPEHYPKANGPDKIMHRNHCIEQIRQYVMCAGDLTPVPTRYYSGLGYNYVDAGYPAHTCRNFDSIREWVTEQFENGQVAKHQHILKQSPHPLV